VLGDPLRFTRSPELHRAGLAAVGWSGDSVALRTPLEGLRDRLSELRAAGYTGVNLTHPLKEAALEQVAKVSETARACRSINTIGFSEEGGWGDTTDGPGFLDLLEELGRHPVGERVVLLGAGGASRSLALSLVSAGARVTVWARRIEAANDSWRGIAGVEVVTWEGPEALDALGRARLVVNATPVSEERSPLPAERLPGGALTVDLTYAESLTPWVVALRGAGCTAIDGLGLLVYQARRSLSLWTGTPVPLEPLARAVGWPR
jgi:shikimate dehydrogenase